MPSDLKPLVDAINDLASAIRFVGGGIVAAIVLAAIILFKR